MRKYLNKTLSACLGAFCAFSIQLAPVVHAQTPGKPVSGPNVTGLADAGASLKSEVAFVVDLNSNEVLFSKNSDTIRPIASISKLMTALVIAKAHLPMNEQIQIIDADVDRFKYSSSRLSVGTTLTRRELLHLALMSSENRAAHALGRTYPGGMEAFVREMNAQARALGMTRSRFVEPTGLSPMNVSSPRDLVRLIQATSEQPLIRQLSTSDEYEVVTSNGKTQKYKNTNRLVRNSNWAIQISKTGYIKESGDCLVMKTQMDGRPVAVVLLNSQGRLTRFADAVRVRHLVQSDYPTLL